MSNIPEPKFKTGDIVKSCTRGYLGLYDCYVYKVLDVQYCKLAKDCQPCWYILTDYNGGRYHEDLFAYPTSQESQLPIYKPESPIFIAFNTVREWIRIHLGVNAFQKRFAKTF